MTLNVLIIQKVTGNYTATYTGNQRSTTQPEPRKQANTRTTRAIRSSVPRKGIPATPQAVRATLAEIAAENPRVILATLPKPEPVTVAKRIKQAKPKERVICHHEFIQSAPNGFELKNTTAKIWETIPYHRAIDGGQVVATEKKKVILKFEKDIYSKEKSIAERVSKFVNKCGGYVMTWKQFAEFSYIRTNA